MFGTESNEQIEENLARLEAVLDRQIQLDSLDELISAINKTEIHPDIQQIAIGIDSSVFLKLANHKQSADIIDYLDTKHTGPLILPGQAIQEFWNNQLAGVDTVSTTLKRKFSELKSEADKIDTNFGDYAEKMTNLLDEFNDEYGYVYDASTKRSTLTLLNFLKRKAYVYYVPRMRFDAMALNRKKTKTPPGFKDGGDGDFFIWADFLYSLLVAKNNNYQFNHVVLLTNDTKKDWSREKIAHPILKAEVKELFGVPFDVWTLEDFYSRMQ